MNEQFQNFLGQPIISRIAIIIFGIAIIWVATSFLQRKLFSKIPDNETRYKAKKASTFIGYFLCIVLLIVVFSDKMGGFTVALGVAGAGIAFALQEVIASFAGWLAIMFGGFYKTGDRVELGGITGDVMDIGVLRTTVMETGQWVDGDLYNGRIVLIANSFIFKAPVFNYSGDFPFLWDEIKIPIKYGSNYDKVKEILLEVGTTAVGDLSQISKDRWKVLQRKFRLEDAQTTPLVSLIANDNWVEFTLRYVVAYNKRRATKTELFSQILKLVEAKNAEIKFASATVQLVEAPDFNVNWKQK